MKNPINILIVVIGFLLAGCVPFDAIKSTAFHGKTLTSSDIKVIYEPVGPFSTYEIYKVGRGYIDITDNEKTVARISSMLIGNLLTKGFKVYFPDEAAKYGLNVINSTQSIPVLRIRASKIKLSCNGSKCRESVLLKGELTDPAVGLLWTFEVQFQSAIADEDRVPDINDDIFKKFQTRLLEQFKKDIVISPSAANTSSAKTIEEKPGEVTNPPRNEIDTSAAKKWISTLEVTSISNSAHTELLPLNNQLTSSLVKEFRKTCIKQVNGFKTLNTAKLDSNTDVSYNLVVKPDVLNDSSANNGKTTFIVTLHRLLNANAFPNSENKIWDLKVSVNTDAASMDKDKLGKLAHLIVGLIDKNGFIPTKCEN